MEPDKAVWLYSCSVNWIEWLIGYNLFPKLPSGLQEVVEEMTAAEHLCPFIESDPLEYDMPDPVEKPCVRDPRSPSAVDPRKQV